MTDLPLHDDSPASRRAAGMMMLVVAAALWSLSGLAVKTARMDPFAFVFYRSLAAAVPMALLLRFSREPAPPARWMTASVCAYVLVVTLLIIAMTLDTAALGILLQYTAPAFCAVFAFAFQRRRIGRLTLVALLIAGIGIAIMIATRPAGRSIIAPAAGLASGACFGALILLLEKIDRSVPGGRANPFQIVFFNNLGAALILLPICLGLGVLGATPVQLAIVGATGVIQLAAPYVLFQLGLRRVHPVDASLLILLEPVLNPVWVAAFYGEVPDRGTFLGGAAILVAMAIEALKGTRLLRGTR